MTYVLGASGYTDYTGGHCRTCGRRMDLHGKREIRCLDCDAKLSKEAARLAACPMICDGDWHE